MKHRIMILLVTLLVMLPLSSAGASDIGSFGDSKASILSWSPHVIDYVYVNDTVNRTVTYSITISGQMAENNWTLDGVPVNGIIMGNTISYVHTWEKRDAGFHTLTYGESKNHAQTAFRWYVNVYETGRYGGGNLFDVIDDVLDNHATDVKIRMLKYTIGKHGNGSNLTAIHIKRLYNEIALQRSLDAKYNIKLAKEVAKIARDDMKDEGLANEFNKLSEIESGREKKEENGTEADNGKETGLDKTNSDYNKDAGGGSNGVSKDGDRSPESGGGSGSSGSTGDNGKSKNSGNSGNSGSSGSSGSSENSGNSGSSGDSQNSGKSEDGGKSKNSEKSEDNGNSGDSGNSGSSGGSGDSGKSEDNKKSGSSGDSQNSGKSGNNDGSENSGESSGNSVSAGNSGNSGSSGSTGDNGKSGNSGSSKSNGNSVDSGESGNSGSSESSGGSGHSGNTGSSGEKDNNGDKGNSGNNGNSGKDKK